MTTNVRLVGPRDTLATAYDILDTGKFRHLPVVQGGEIVGLLTQRDLLRGALGGLSSLTVTAQRELLSATHVESVMVTDPETIDASAPVAVAGRMMLDNKLGCVPVTEGPRLVGIVTEADFVRHVVDSELGY